MYPRSSQENNFCMFIFMSLPVVQNAGSQVSWHGVVMILWCHDVSLASKGLLHQLGATFCIEKLVHGA